MRLVIAVVILTANCLFAAASNDIIFGISTARRPAVYHLGERIELKLAFSTTHPGKYGISYGGTLKGSEDYTVIPTDGVEDPYVDPGQLGFVIAGSILSSYGRLDGGSLPITADLNERLRFKKPGHYRLHAVSSRISYFHEIGKPSPGNFQISSNEIELTIMPASPDWIANELQVINRLFDSPNGQEKMTATRRLRYLNAKEAVPQIIRRLPDSLNQPYHYELYEGLLESSWSDEAITSLDATLRNPEIPVGYDTVELLATVVLTKEYKNKPLPSVKSNRPDQLKTLQAAMEDRQNRFKTLAIQYTSELSKSVPARRGKPRADAIFALWKTAELYKPPAPLASPAELPQLRQDVVSVANDLSFEQWDWLLSFYWEGLSKAKLLPLIKDLATAPEPIKTGPLGEDLRKIAALRWCELDTNCVHNPKSDR